MVHVYKLKDGRRMIFKRLSVGMFLSKAMARLEILMFLLHVLYSLTVKHYHISRSFPHKGERDLRLNMFQET